MLIRGMSVLVYGCLIRSRLENTKVRIDMRVGAAARINIMVSFDCRVHEGPSRFEAAFN